MYPPDELLSRSPKLHLVELGVSRIDRGELVLFPPVARSYCEENTLAEAGLDAEQRIV